MARATSIIFLDETMGTIDSELKQKCLSCIRECTNKSLVTIMQDGTRGIFDKIIELK